MDNVEQLKQAFEKFTDAVRKAIDIIKNAFQRFRDTFYEVARKAGMTPKQYGIYMIRKSERVAKAYTSYRHDQKIMKHLPYQRRNY